MSRFSDASESSATFVVRDNQNLIIKVFDRLVPSEFNKKSLINLLIYNNNIRVPRPNLLVYSYVNTIHIKFF